MNKKKLLELKPQLNEQYFKDSEIKRGKIN